MQIEGFRKIELKDMIESKKRNLFSMVDRNSNLSLIESDSFLNELNNYIWYVMKRDIPYKSLVVRKEVVEYITDYLSYAKQKGYITNNNVLNVLKKIIISTGSIKELNDPFLEGEASEYYLKFNFENSNFKLHMKHIIFHELTHVIAPVNNQSLGKYTRKYVDNKNDDNNEFHTVKRNDDYDYTTIISNNMISFLKEIIAEATACDLAQTYQPSKEILLPNTDLCSDWVVLNNKSYQQVGYEFLKTVYDIYDERELFKKITLDAINNQDICLKILKRYQKMNPLHWKDDLHKITTILGNLTVNHNLGAREISEARILMEKYVRTNDNSNSVSNSNSNGRRRI
ncbi:MAG: hypothetical protein VZS44_06815 [Bacilli bacterium]|nr:hypothetical protein [Bacilli bacterium]